MTIETDADALAITTRIGEAQKAATLAERERVRREIDDVFAGAVLDDDMQRLVDKMRRRIALPGDGRS